MVVREHHNVEAEFDPDFIKGGGGGAAGPNVDAGEVMKTVSGHQLFYSLAGLALGVVCILGGIWLFYAGITGEISWTLSILGAESNLADAAPGGLLFVVGLFVVFVTRYTYKVKKSGS